MGLRIRALWLAGYVIPLSLAVHSSPAAQTTPCMSETTLHRAPQFDLTESEVFAPKLSVSGFVGPEAVGVTDTLSARKTGTTIVGVFCRKAGAVVLGADTRATNGEVVADKRCEKIHRIAPNIYCCGAGTAADAEHLTQAVAGELASLRLQMRLVSSSNPFAAANISSRDGLVDNQSRVAAAHCLLKKQLFESKGSCECALVLGGVDCVGGGSLVAVHGGGSSEKVETFTAMGSGELAAMSALEAGWHPELDLNEAVALVTSAVRAGVLNDLGSGSCVDLCVISPPPLRHNQPGVASVRYIRGHRREEVPSIAAPPPDASTGVAALSPPPTRAKKTRRAMTVGPWTRRTRVDTDDIELI